MHVCRIGQIEIPHHTAEWNTIWSSCIKASAAGHRMQQRAENFMNIGHVLQHTTRQDEIEFTADRIRRGPLSKTDPVVVGDPRTRKIHDDDLDALPRASLDESFANRIRQRSVTAPEIENAHIVSECARGNATQNVMCKSPGRGERHRMLLIPVIHPIVGMKHFRTRHVRCGATAARAASEHDDVGSRLNSQHGPARCRIQTDGAAIGGIDDFVNREMTRDRPSDLHAAAGYHMDEWGPGTANPFRARTRCRTISPICAGRKTSVWPRWSR